MIRQSDGKAGERIIFGVAIPEKNSPFYAHNLDQRADIYSAVEEIRRHESLSLSVQWVSLLRPGLNNSTPGAATTLSANRRLSIFLPKFGPTLSLVTRRRCSR